MSSRVARLVVLVAVVVVVAAVYAVWLATPQQVPIHACGGPYAWDPVTQSCPGGPWPTYDHPYAY